MALSVSAVLLLAILVFILIKKAGMKTLHAVVCVLFGFYLANTNIAPTISEVTASVGGMINNLSF
ncbi:MULTISPECIES: hypothetical protein [Streptomyces]|uniref:hypothetical protein n=1 Tax=Streptomyces TaxID=1883 RepID=UPI000CD4DF95|nr:MULTISPECIES: hypothetical protein [Streptomyces]